MGSNSVNNVNGSGGVNNNSNSTSVKKPGAKKETLELFLGKKITQEQFDEADLNKDGLIQAGEEQKKIAEIAKNAPVLTSQQLAELISSVTETEADGTNSPTQPSSAAQQSMPSTAQNTPAAKSETSQSIPSAAQQQSTPAQTVQPAQTAPAPQQTAPAVNQQPAQPVQNKAATNTSVNYDNFFGNIDFTPGSVIAFADNAFQTQMVYNTQMIQMQNGYPAYGAYQSGYGTGMPQQTGNNGGGFFGNLINALNPLNLIPNLLTNPSTRNAAIGYATARTDLGRQVSLTPMLYAAGNVIFNGGNGYGSSFGNSYGGTFASMPYMGGMNTGITGMGSYGSPMAQYLHYQNIMPWLSGTDRISLIPQIGMAGNALAANYNQALTAAGQARNNYIAGMDNAMANFFTSPAYQQQQIMLNTTSPTPQVNYSKYTHPDSSKTGIEQLNALASKTETTKYDLSVFASGKEEKSEITLPKNANYDTWDELFKSVYNLKNWDIPKIKNYDKCLETFKLMNRFHVENNRVPQGKDGHKVCIANFKFEFVLDKDYSSFEAFAKENTNNYDDNTAKTVADKLRMYNPGITSLNAGSVINIPAEVINDITEIAIKTAAAEAGKASKDVAATSTSSTDTTSSTSDTQNTDKAEKTDNKKTEEKKPENSKEEKAKEEKIPEEKVIKNLKKLDNELKNNQNVEDIEKELTKEYSFPDTALPFMLGRLEKYNDDKELAYIVAKSFNKDENSTIVNKALEKYKSDNENKEKIVKKFFNACVEVAKQCGATKIAGYNLNNTGNIDVTRMEVFIRVFGYWYNQQMQKNS